MIIFKTTSYEERRNDTRLIKQVMNTQRYKLYQVGLCIFWYVVFVIKLDVEAQVKHLEEILCLLLATHLEIVAI